MLHAIPITECELPDEVKTSLRARSGCVAGALGEKDYIQKIKNAGFNDVKVESIYTFTDRDGEISGLFSGCCGDGSEQDNIWAWIPKLHGNICSIKISAYKA